MNKGIRSRIVFLLLAAGAALPVSAQQKYTNADLEKYRLPGAYSNEDLKALPPLPVQGAPLYHYPKLDLSKWIREAEAREARFRALVYARDLLQAELDYEMELLETSYSARGGDPRTTLLPGRLSKVKPRLDYLRRRVFLLNWQIDRFDR